MVHEADKMPLPEDDGILISTGFNTAIGIKKVSNKRILEQIVQPYVSNGNTTSYTQLVYTDNLHKQFI